MLHRPMRTLAALLVTATLAVPGAALATVDPFPASMGAPGLKAPLDPAAQKISREQAITLARTLFGIPTEMGEPDVSLNQMPQGASWYLQFHDAVAGQQPPSVMINVGVDAETGALIQYSKWNMGRPADPVNAAPAFTLSEAEGKAKDWLALLAPTLRDVIRPVESPEGYGYYGPGAMTYTFRWNRMVQGYPSRAEAVSIVIDARTGQLQEFNRNMWASGDYKLPNPLLTREKAEAAYRQVPMQLYYQRFYERGVGQGEWQLVYRPATEYYPMVDQSGKLLSPSGQPVDLAFLKQMVKVPAPDHAWQPPAHELTRDEALAMAKHVTGLTAEPTNASYQDAAKEQEGQFQGWMFSWEMAKGEGENYSVQVDSVRGVLTTFNHWSMAQPVKEGEKPKLSEDAARKLAVEFVRANRPDLGGSLVLMPNPELRDPYYMAKMAGMEMPEYNFNFQLLKNGALVTGPNVNLTLDARTGQVRNFWSYDSVAGQEFPSPKAAMKPEAAMDAFLKQPGLELTWMQFWAPPMPGQDAQTQAPQLVWGPAMPDGAYALDAITGHPLDYQGRDLLEAAKRPVDIEGHFAQREIELLWTRGVVELESDGKFNPDQMARVGDVVRWLVLTRGMAPYPLYDFKGAFRGILAGDKLAAELAKSPAGPYLGAALQAGIILPEDVMGGLKPDAAVSRELLALWTARAMGYGQVVRMPNRIEVPFADRASIGPWFANAVGLLSGLGVVKGGSDAMFEPERAATRGEAAKMIFAVAQGGHW